MPNADTTAIRNKARRLKDLAITRAIYVLENQDKVDKETYENTYQTVLKNSVPRTQEVTGEDGEPVKLTFDQVFNAVASKTERDSSESSQV